MIRGVLFSRELLPQDPSRVLLKRDHELAKIRGLFMLDRRVEVFGHPRDEPAQEPQDRALLHLETCATIEQRLPSRAVHDADLERRSLSLKRTSQRRPQQ